MKRIALHIALLLMPLSGLWAQSVSATLDTNAILIGDWMKLTLQAEAPEAQTIQWPVVPPAMEIDSGVTLEVLKSSGIDTLTQNGVTTMAETLTLTVFDTGYYVLKPFIFGIQKEDGSIDSLETEPRLIEVYGVELGEQPELKDIKGPLDLPFKIEEVLTWLIVGGVVLLVIALAIVLLVFFLGKKKATPVFRRPEPALPPHEHAILRLNELKERQLWQNGKVKEYYIHLSDIIREYLENRFELPALEQTTDEIIAEFGALDALDGQLVRQLQETLELADLAKFARVTPLDTDNIRSMKFAYALVEATRPTEQKEDEEEQEDDNRA